ncbi:MAG: hypothetical protein ABJZ55_10565 [Fuerstiella sp.]
MTAFFISLLAVLFVALWFNDTEVDQTPNAQGTARRLLESIAVLSVCSLVWTSSLCAASQQTTAPEPPAQPVVKVSQDGTLPPDDSKTKDRGKKKVGTTIQSDAKGSAIQVIIRSQEDSTFETAADQESSATAKDLSEDTSKPAGTEQTEAAPDSSDIFFVITKEGLNKLIAASGGDIEAFDVETVKQASALMPLSLSQSRALSPVLRTAASPIMLKRLFNPTNLKMIQGLLEGSHTPAETELPTIDHQAWDLFLLENSWIENPGIGQVVTTTEFVEAGSSEQIAKEVQSAIKEAVVVEVRKQAKEKYGVENLDPSTLNLSLIDASEAIAQTAQWKEQITPENVMVKTHVLVDLPKKEIGLLMASVKSELQKVRLIGVAIVIGLIWLGMALSSVAFRTFHTKSRVWKLLVIPVLTLAVIPCLVGAMLVIGQMANGDFF